MANDVTLKVGFDIDKFQTELNKTQTSLNNWSKSIKSTLSSAFVGFGAMQVGKEMIQVTAEFQKFESLLTNTLGSNSQAKEALDNIRKFAVATPFEVSEITAAYVRWANMGLTPTIDRMRKLGDVASSLGAGFEQTAEAFKDLMVGQTKRIEEVGISATQMNGKIQLSFKGVNLEIEKNAEGVQKALDVYSQLNGVLGTSDAIAKTLGGQISNLSDAWSNFLLTQGEKTSGVMSSLVVTTTNLLNGLSKGTAGLTKGVSIWDNMLEALGIHTDATLNAIAGMAHGASSTWDLVEKSTQKSEKSVVNIIDTVTEYRAEIKKLTEANENLSIADSKTILANGILIDQYQKQIKVLEDLAKVAFKSKAGAATIIPEFGLSLSKYTPGGVAMPYRVGSPISDAQLKEYRRSASEISTIQADLSGETSEFVASMAETLGASINGNVDFGKAFLSSLAKFAGSFGRQLIALGIAQLALKKSFKNPYAAIAAGVALVAISGVIGSSIKGFERGVGSGNVSGASDSGSRSDSATQLATNAAQNETQYKAVIRGQDLYVVLANYERNNQSTRAIGG